MLKEDILLLYLRIQDLLLFSQEVEQFLLVRIVQRNAERTTQTLEEEGGMRMRMSPEKLVLSD
jgi:hypothetical protein